MKLKSLLLALISLAPLLACESTQDIKNKEAKAEAEAQAKESAAILAKDLDFSEGLPTLVYKTRNDYSKNVAVMLTKEKNMVEGFPEPQNLFASSIPTYPTQLADGYLLDHVGINPATVAFIDMTYLDYSKLPRAPYTYDLYERVIDKNPLTECYDCGNRFQFKDPEAALNILIENNRLDKCKKIK